MAGSAEPAVRRCSAAVLRRRAIRPGWSARHVRARSRETWSAAEFAAVLQDNKAAVIFGARTGGTGCGHTDGGTPTTLKNSGAVPKLPDCVRFPQTARTKCAALCRTRWLRADDGVRFRTRLIAEKLASAVAKVKAPPAQPR